MPETFSEPLSAEKASTLALRLAHAENALRALASGQVDAIIAPGGESYLLHPPTEHLRQNEKRLEAVIESTADVIVVVDRGGVILSQSHAASRVLGYNPEELLGSRIFKLIHADDVESAHSAFFNVIEGFEQNTTAQFRHRARDGSWRVIEATVGKLRDVFPATVVMSLRSIARRRTPEAASVKENPVAQDRFLAMLSHELRTPLHPALLGIQVLEEDERLSEARPTLTMIRRNLELQARLLEELIDFTTVAHYKVRLHLESIDAHAAIRYVLDICQSEISTEHIEVMLDFRAAESVVRVDSARLQQVMWNLVKNAVKFSMPGGTISIATVNDLPGQLTIEFADQGIGIEAELLPLVFDSFQQGNGLMTQLGGGLGLGLFIAKGLAEAQHGTLTVASEGPGRGTRFRLTLPTAEISLLASP